MLRGVGVACALLQFVHHIVRNERIIGTKQREGGKGRGE